MSQPLNGDKAGSAYPLRLSDDGARLLATDAMAKSQTMGFKDDTGTLLRRVAEQLLARIGVPSADRALPHWTDEDKARLNLGLFGKSTEPLAWIRADGLLIGSKEDADKVKGFTVYPLYAAAQVHSPFGPPAAVSSANEGWQPIETAPLGIWGIGWAPAWRRTFPAMRNGANGAVWVDTCEPQAHGWQTIATHWRPALDIPSSGAALGVHAPDSKP